jgi:hypothetical protein
MNTFERVGAQSRLVALAAFLSPLAVVAGCASTRPAPYALSPGGIGVAVISAPQSEIATQGNIVAEGAAKGFGTGLGAVGGPWAGPAIVLGLFIAPFTMAYGAAQGAQCEKKFNAAYPRLSEKFPVVVQREISPADMQDQFAIVLRSSTAVPIVELETPTDTDDGGREQQLFVAAAQRDIGNLFLVNIHEISLEPEGSDCDSWRITVHMRVKLWSIADHKVVLYPQSGNPYVQGPLSELKSVLDESGALNSRFVPNFKLAAENMLDVRRIQLPR